MSRSSTARHLTVRLGAEASAPTRSAPTPFPARARAALAGLDHPVNLRPAFELPWDFTVLDRLTAPLTHYHD